MVTHSIDTFRRIRSYTAENKLPGDAAIHIFLFMLGTLISRKHSDHIGHSQEVVKEFALDDNYIDIFQSVGQATFRGIVEHFCQPRYIGNDLQVRPELLVRHAGGIVFQEAHYDLISWDPSDLLGLPGISQVKTMPRGGVHFTPPGLARMLVEQSLQQSRVRDSITIMDPACGSGVFLQEALRALRRSGFAGNINLIGRDSSVHAIAMARFVVQRALLDWAAPEGQARTVDIRQWDSLDEGVEWPHADVIVMNPPFISWRNLTLDERARLRNHLGPLYSGRADLSMAFIHRALNGLGEGGILGTLMPASLLTLEAARKWRHFLADTSDVTFLSLLGDHSLFRHAIVEVAAAVFRRRGRGERPGGEYVSVWTGERRGAASDALRAVRKLMDQPLQVDASGEAWRVSRERRQDLEAAATWRPRPNRLQKILDRLTETCRTTVKDLYTVRQGTIPGLREAFILSKEEFDALPRDEQSYFRPVAENANIIGGHVVVDRYLFYPNAVDGTDIANEEGLRETVPQFFQSHLRNYQDRLIRRARIEPDQWWRLSWPRAWVAERRTKLITAYFGRAGSFAWDENGDLVVVQGYGWLPAERLQKGLDSMPQAVRGRSVRAIYLAYLGLCNSGFFDRLLAEFCPHVAGGQFNLSKRYVDRVPLPELPELMLQSGEMSDRVHALARYGALIHAGEVISYDEVDQLVAALYRIPPTSWPAEAA